MSIYGLSIYELSIYELDTRGQQAYGFAHRYS